jgi:squalene synthase HpnD
MTEIATEAGAAASTGDGSPQARASGSSFYLAMRLLPQAQREAMFEIYGFCRAVDDIADGDLPGPQRLAALARWRADIHALYAAGSSARLPGLARAVAQFGLRKDDFLAVIDGMAMDAEADIRAPSFERLDLYCDRVASAVGRLSVRVFGMDEADGLALAHHLGRALQLTNILRDVDEDAGIGRLYLPREALDAAGIASRDPAAVAALPDLTRACAPVVARARTHFAEARAVMARAPRAATRAPRLMTAAYGAIFEALVARGWAAPRLPVRIGRLRLLGILARAAIAR